MNDMSNDTGVAVEDVIIRITDEEDKKANTKLLRLKLLRAKLLFAMRRVNESIGESDEQSNIID